MVGCSYCGKLLDRVVFCNPSHKVMYYRRNGKHTALPETLRWTIWRRDNFTCKDCGKQEDLVIDHINPQKNGGGHNIENLQTLCATCNKKKGAKVTDKKFKIDDLYEIHADKVVYPPVRKVSEDLAKEDSHFNPVPKPGKSRK